MARHGKRYRALREQVNPEELHSLSEALKKSKEGAGVKFDETVELAVRLGVDPRHADQMVRGSVVLPHGSGKSVRVLAFAKGEKEIEATEAGAEFVGGDDLVKKIQDGWLDFDRVVATPDMMASVGKLGKILGPRGLMPNPKSGTVSFDVSLMVRELKAGKVEFRVDRAGNVHVPVGRSSFEHAALEENARSVLEALLRAKPPTSKGQYMKGITVSTTMGVGVKVDHVHVANTFR